MEPLISIAIAAICGVVGWLLWAFQQIVRDCDAGRIHAESKKNFVGVYVVSIYCLSLAAFGLAANGVFKLVEEFGLSTALPSLTIPVVVLYGVWLWGWTVGREERRFVKGDS